MKRFIPLLAGLLLAASGLRAQNTVNGTITSSDGNPVPGASVIIEGSTLGATSDAKGNFQIKVRNANDVLVFSFLGYNSVRETVGQRSRIDVVLVPADTRIDDVVVVGYGSLRRKDMTGAVASIKADALQNRVLFSVDDALAGGVAGLMVNSSSGKPGSESNMLIRGANSLTGSTAPLIVLDGFPLFDVSTSTGGGIDGYDTGMSSLSMINPDDIASIEVLKDASATALYGSKAANGVIMITTKKGEAGKMKISYNMTSGVQVISKTMEMMEAYEFVRLQEELMTESEITSSNGGYFQTYNGRTWTLDDYRNIEQYDWQKFIFHPAFKQNHNVSVSGGSNDIRYNASFNYYDQDGIVIESNYRKINGRANMIMKRNRLTVNLAVNYSNTVSSGASPSQNNSSGMNNLFYSVLGYRPVTEPNVPLSSLMTNIMDESVDQLVDYRFNPVL